MVLMSRVHPGESNSSWIIKGMIDFLINDKEPLSLLLREKFIFKIYPMLNPDGVRYGNYRCSFFGKDLNRKWLRPNNTLYECQYGIKNMIEQSAVKGEVFMVCDIHGHSRSKDVFIYANRYNSEEDPYHLEKNSNIKLLPYICSKVSNNLSWSKCTYS